MKRGGHKRHRRAHSSPFVALYIGKGAAMIANCERRVWLVEAIRRNDVNATRILLSQGTDIQHSDLLLHALSKSCKREMMEFLLGWQKDFDVNIIYSGYGMPLFHFAVLKEDIEIMKTLIQHGADVNSRDIFGSTPLHKALPYLSEEVVTLLLDHGADVNALNDCGELPLHKVWRCELHGEAASIIFKHIVKLNTADMFLSEKNTLDLGQVSQELRDEVEKFRTECRREIEEIKITRIGTGPFTFYHILSGDPNRMANYAKNDSIVDEINLGEYKRRYPLYSSIIRNNFRMGLERSKLIEKGKRKFSILFENLPLLPMDCVEKIFSYLTNKDLKIFVGYNMRTIVHWSSLTNIILDQQFSDIVINNISPTYSSSDCCCTMFDYIVNCFRGLVHRVRQITCC